MPVRGGRKFLHTPGYDLMMTLLRETRLAAGLDFFRNCGPTSTTSLSSAAERIKFASKIYPLSKVGNGIAKEVY